MKSWTRRAMYSVRMLEREAKNTRVHFLHRKKCPPAWTVDTLARCPEALNYLARRLDRQKTPAAVGEAAAG